jgi:hypothetical protein
MDGTQSFLTAIATAAIAGSAEDIYGVNEGSIEPDLGDYDNEGDDAVLSTWSWFNFADVNVQAGYISFRLLNAITGSALSSSGAGNTQMFGIDLWHEDSFNMAPKPMLIKMPSKDHLGVVRTLSVGLYRVNFKPLTFDGPSYKDGLKANYNGRAVLSAVDETGAAFADGKKRLGRLLSTA